MEQSGSNASAEHSSPVSWKDVLHGERELPYFKEIMAYLGRERATGKVIYPKNNEIFGALQHTLFEDVKVVILGQDPYHGPSQAHGLCFSVREGIPPPPSLQNIFQELQDDVGIAKPKSGSLEKWTREGVLLLNTSLTVEAGQPMSHAKLGWEKFTDRIVAELNSRREGIVFILWGAHAQKKGAAIDTMKHLIIKTPHPSPLSAHRGFFKSKPFSKANAYLASKGKTPVDWSL